MEVNEKERQERLKNLGYLYRLALQHDVEQCFKDIQKQKEGSDV